MHPLTQITLHNMRGSEALMRRIREKCARLERFHPHLLFCRVGIERIERAGVRARPYVATVRIGVPGHEIVVSHEHLLDPHLAVRDAFAAARRRLKDAAAITRGEVKSHANAAEEET